MTAMDPATKPATENPVATGNASTKGGQIRLTRWSPGYWRVTIDNPPVNVMGPEMVTGSRSPSTLPKPTSE